MFGRLMVNPSEAKTKKELIDPALRKADWDVHNVVLLSLMLNSSV